jgi:hypothetical protein
MASWALLDGADIVALGAGNEITNAHVFDHAGAQWADGFVRKRRVVIGGEVGVLDPSILKTAPLRPLSSSRHLVTLHLPYIAARA